MDAEPSLSPHESVCADREVPGFASDPAMPVWARYFVNVSQQNIESMPRSADAFNRSDRPAWLAEFDPAVEMVPAREWPESEAIRGAEAVWDFYAEVTAASEEASFGFGEIIDAGAGKLVANLRREARGKASGAGVEFSYWIVGTKERRSGSNGSLTETRHAKPLGYPSSRFGRAQSRRRELS